MRSFPARLLHPEMTARFVDLLHKAQAQTQAHEAPTSACPVMCTLSACYLLEKQFSVAIHQQILKSWWFGRDGCEELLQEETRYAPMETSSEYSSMAVLVYTSLLVSRGECLDLFFAGLVYSGR